LLKNSYNPALLFGVIDFVARENKNSRNHFKGISKNKLWLNFPKETNSQLKVRIMIKKSFLEAMDKWRTPERLVLVTSANESGEPHVITVGWKMRTSFNPPMFAIAVGHGKYMHECISQSEEFVLAVPGEDLANEVLACGNQSNSIEDRFKKYGLVAKPGESGKSPLIENCIANFECQVMSQIESGDHTIFIGQVVNSYASDKEKQNLLVVDNRAGYDVLAEEAPYAIGVVKD
jgi:flavin reductase (DIM6/NTAB) family NADH-FMN oxidoreductase RutF